MTSAFFPLTIMEHYRMRAGWWSNLAKKIELEMLLIWWDIQPHTAASVFCLHLLASLNRLVILEASVCHIRLFFFKLMDKAQLYPFLSLSLSHYIIELSLPLCGVSDSRRIGGDSVPVTFHPEFPWPPNKLLCCCQRLALHGWSSLKPLTLLVNTSTASFRQVLGFLYQGHSCREKV